MNTQLSQLIDASPNGQALIAALEAHESRLRDEMIAEGQVEIDNGGNFRPRNLAGLQRLANLFSRTELVPAHYRAKPANCAIAIQMALRCGVDIMTFMQASYVVQGKAAIESKLANAMLYASGLINGRIRYTFERDPKGKAIACTATATEKATGQELSQRIDWEMVTAENWNKNPKWNSLRDLMFQYRASMFLIRVYFPDVLMGMSSKEEEEDMAAAKGVGTAGATVVETITPRMSGKPMKAIEHKAELPQITSEHDPPPPYSEALAADWLGAAKTLEELDAAANALDALEGADRAAIGGMYDSYKAKLKGGAE